ncbi:MAG: hypothetical protein KF859_05000 [Phycisphaeraceae bacterium]|nr:hypothetical protein [Phycisphaeraceae bacterium]
MTVTDFLQHWSLTENPFRGEEARADAVFSRMKDGAPGDTLAPPATMHHADFEKILGDLRRPGSSVVFGEKGSGKTAIRMQLARRIDAYNAANPTSRILLIAYDDLNGVLDRLHERVGGKTPLESLQKVRLVDHIDAILHAVTPRLVDALLDPSRSPEGIDLGEGLKPSRRLSPTAKLDLLLLQSIYDRPQNAQQRTGLLRRRLRVPVPPAIFWGTLFAWVMPMLLIAALVWVQFFTLPAPLDQRLGYWALGALAGLYALFILKWSLWDRFSLLRTGHRLRKQLRVFNRSEVSLARSLRQLAPGVRDASGLPISDSDEPRYLMLERLKGALRCLGFAGIIVVMDRVDEPTLVRGDPDRMKAVVWPLLNNKFLQQEGLAFKLLLPMELRHAVFRESSAFFQEARLDKQSLIEHLSWSGATLYDLCEARMAACALDGAKAPKLIDLFAEDVTRQDIVDALDRLHQPRDALKLMYRCMTEHCASVTRGQQEWKIPRHILAGVVKQEAERVQQMFRGIRPG